MDHSEAGKKGYEKTGSRLKQLGEERTRRAIEVYEANPKFCLSCGTKLSFEKRRGRFCNKSCSAQHNNRLPVRRKKPKLCINCGEPVAERHNKYCSDCVAKRVYNRPKSFADARDHVARKRILLETRGHRCERCGLAEWLEQPIPLELHHMDGDSDNNTEGNLQLLCPNCHALTENYKGANKGKNGVRQRWRRDRYSRGLTW
ncbi:MAG: hypothetical protein GC204_17125 [Chloroflexi bacterium]|nr:hypothetical protein [Chloroflexota bacterium]